MSEITQADASLPENTRDLAEDSATTSAPDSARSRVSNIDNPNNLDIDTPPSPAQPVGEVGALEAIAPVSSTLTTDNGQRTTELERSDLPHTEPHTMASALVSFTNYLQTQQQQHHLLAEAIMGLTSHFGTFLERITSAPPSVATTFEPEPQLSKPAKPQSKATSETNNHKEPKTNPRSGDETISQAIQAIMQHNDRCHSPEDKWAISISLLKKLPLGKGQGKITKIFNSLKEEIEQHNSRHQLDAYHNRGKDPSSLIALLSL